MKIEFIIYSHFFKERGMKVKGDWNFPHLPRIGEENFTSHYNVSE